MSTPDRIPAAAPAGPPEASAQCAIPVGGRSRAVATWGGQHVYWLLIAPALVAMAVFYVYPLVRVLWISVTEPAWGVGNYALLLTSPAVQRILITTARICAVTSALTLILGYLVAYAMVHVSEARLPYVVITVSTSLANLDPRLEQAARNLGASVSQTVRLVIVPCILPGILSGAIFAFVHSWDEIVVLLFITSRRLYLLPRAMWAGINENVDPTIAAVATALMLLTLTGLLVQRGVRLRQARPRRLRPEA